MIRGEGDSVLVFLPTSQIMMNYDASLLRFHFEGDFSHIDTTEMTECNKRKYNGDCEQIAWQLHADLCHVVFPTTGNGPGKYIILLIY